MTSLTAAVTAILLAMVGLMGETFTFDLRGAPSATLGEVSEQSGHPKQIRSVDASLNQPIQVCGIRLLEAVRVICRNRGGFLMTRRSDPSLSLAPLYEEVEMPMSNSLTEDYQNDAFAQGDMDLPETAPPAGGGDWWNLSPSKLIAYKVLTSESSKGSGQRQQGQGQHNRFRRSIVDECCKRQCNRSDMVKYCIRA